jgi:biopolymer transport protein TolQ
VTTDLSIVHLFLGASPIVQLVMLALLLVSVLSWFVIFHRGRVLREARRDADAFEQRFWSGTELGALFKEISRDDYAPTGMERIFEAGFREFARLRRREGNVGQSVVEGAQRTMRVALMREVDALEHHLSFLATVGSTSPYVGLFGTVWGIMNSFRALGNVQQATIAMVAPGIAEALVATAMGLFAAIPAVISYNRFANDAERLGNRYENFLEEFSAVLQHQVED